MRIAQTLTGVLLALGLAACQLPQAERNTEAAAAAVEDGNELEIMEATGGLTLAELGRRVRGSGDNSAAFVLVLRHRGPSHLLIDCEGAETLEVEAERNQRPCHQLELGQRRPTSRLGFFSWHEYQAGNPSHCGVFRSSTGREESRCW